MVISLSKNFYLAVIPELNSGQVLTNPPAGGQNLFNRFLYFFWATTPIH